MYRIFVKKAETGARSRARVNANEVLAQELHKPVIKNLKEVKSVPGLKIIFIISLFPKNWGVKYLICIIDVFIKYTWVKPLKDKNAKTVLYGFIRIVNESKGKPNKLCTDQGREVFKNFM